MNLSINEAIAQIHKNEKNLALNNQGLNTRLALQLTRDHLLERLASTSNSYHNLTHTVDMHGRLCDLLRGLDKRMDLWKSLLSDDTIWYLLEAALRHDDDHSGDTYRQNTSPDLHMSNEELAKLNLEREMQGTSIIQEKVFFMSSLILSSSFGQDELPTDDPRYRPYEPNTPMQYLFVFADIGGGAMRGWDYFIDESLLFLAESGNTPSYIGEWIQGRIGFMNYVSKFFNTHISKYLRTAERNQYKENISTILNRLENMSNEDANKLQQRIFGEYA